MTILASDTIQFTTALCAAASNLSVQSIRKAIKSGDLPAVKRGKPWLVTLHDLERWANSRGQRLRWGRRGAMWIDR